MHNFILIILIAFGYCFPCSSFLLKDDSTFYVGKNYDWDVENGRIIINTRDIHKIAFKVKNPVSWTSKYASITFNQYGQDFPCGGMNEKGLVIEALWLNETIYPKSTDSLQNIDNMQWIQYHLDNSSNINDIIKFDSTFQISPTSSSAVHCFISDKSGKSLIFESVDGITHHYRTENNNSPFLTNNSYDKSIKMLNKCKIFGGDLEVPKGKGSITRFIQIGIALKNYSEQQSTPIEYSFNILKSVSLGMYTKWSIVYDINNLTVYYKSKSAMKIKSVKLTDFNLNCTGNSKSIQIVNNYKGNISSYFNVFTLDQNKEMVLESFQKTPFLKYMDPEYTKEIYGYPENFECKK